ncbi:hypothetical protein H2199_000300 [Coniosporium tulheliwenetii]|uniref:Uncharacterized protein n=1 Tax=Coniosporium tulheliwenetii TaxID=3383036 RepID=A0ACC2ZQ53_9PEZI|nr:hypothetical protein H2199_000300 [Cladosporium sp. JES 115]
MWKRLPRHNRGKENQIGNPVLIETTYDATLLGRTRDISNMQIEHPSLSARPAFGRRNTEDVLQELPQLPFRSLTAPFDGTGGRYSTAPSASVYSQPSPAVPFEWARPITDASTLVEECQISPPSSPELDVLGYDGQSYPDREVSPVDNSVSSHSDGKENAQLPSHIPRLRRAGADVTTRWDDFSGYHGATAHDGRFNPGSGNTTGIDGSTAMKSTERESRFKEKGLTIDTRPPWKGASGRSAIVGPLKDNKSLYGRSLAVPTRNDRRPSPTVSDRSGLTTPSSAVQTARRLLIGTSAEETNKELQGMDDETIKPIVPLKAGRNSPLRNVSPTTPASARVNPYPSPITPSVQSQVPASSGTYHQELRHSPDSEDLPQAARRASLGTVDSTHTARQVEERDPVSRFSWTTYATSTTYQQSPPSSPPPPMPNIFPSSITSTPTPTAAAVMSRRRPVPSIASSITSTTSRKPVPASTTTSPATHTATQRNFSAASPSDVSKALPQPPTMAESSDHVSSLQAQLDDLQLRRRNISRVVRDLSSNAATSPLVADLKQRREAERRIREYEAELMEIGSREHEVGLRLHRALRKKDREEGGGYDSVLWVRRVTG